MSIIQGGNGFPFLNECVYNYLCGGESTGISVTTESVPDSTLGFALENVSGYIYRFTIVLISKKMYFLSLQLDSAESDDDVKMVLAIDEVLCLLAETGYRKPLTSLTLSDTSSLKAVLVDYHCMLKAKAAMDQFSDGLQRLKCHDLMQRFPNLLKPCFVSSGKTITASKWL